MGRAAWLAWAAARQEVAAETVPDLRALLTSERLRELLDFWTGLQAAAGDLPLKAQLDPAAVPQLLPVLMLVERRGEDFHTRVAGTTLRDIFDLEFTGRNPLEALPSWHRAGALRSYRRASVTGRPWLVRALYDVRLTSELLYERLVLPLRDEAGERRFLLIGVDWQVLPEPRSFRAADFAGLDPPRWRLEYEQA